jgi:hypothetical protein
MPTLLAPAFLITPTELSKVLPWKMAGNLAAGGGGQQIRDTLKSHKPYISVGRQEVILSYVRVFEHGIQVVVLRYYTR